MKLIVSGLQADKAVVPLLKISLAGESNAISANDATEQDFGVGGKQEDLPSNGAIPNAIYFDTYQTWEPYQLDMNWSPDNPSWGVEYRVAKQALENDISAESLELLKYSIGGSRIGESGAWNIVNGSYQIGMRTITGYANGYRPDFFIWIQGLNDAVSDSLANAYESNLRGWAADTMTHINPKYIVIVRASTLTIPSYSYRVPTIQAAQDQVSSENSQYILHTPDPTLELNADGIHYSPDGMDDLARGIYSTIKPYISTLNSIP